MPGSKSTSSVFGVSNTILKDSYVDRGGLDEQLPILLRRPIHVALRGESRESLHKFCVPSLID